jgi:hypothetical protein
MAVGEGFYRMAYRTVQCATGHCPVRQPRHQAVGFRPLVLLTTGPPDSPVVHQTGPVHYPVRLLVPALTSARAGVHYLLSLFICRRPLARSSCYSAGTPDSPVLHRTVRWIIAERPPQIPEAGKFDLILPDAPDTVRWHTGQSGAPDQGSLRFNFAPLFWTLSFVFVLVRCEPLAPVGHIF